MKTILSLFFTVFLLYNSTYEIQAQQGSDIVILIDNSSSVNSTEFLGMRTSIDSIISNVLDCNPNNRIAVVHYGTRLLNGFNPNFQPKIFIESNFTNDLNTALNYQRQLTSGDYLHESTQLVGNALDNVANVNIISPQTSLTRDPANSFSILLFTDANRGNNPLSPPVSGTGSYLVNASNPIPISSNSPFQVFTNFKNNRGATFFVIHNPSNAQAASAALSIASRGGSYFGPDTLETYPADPDNNLLPRFYFPTASFLLSENDIAIISNDLCASTVDPCDISVINGTTFINQGTNLQWVNPTGFLGNYFLEFIGSNDCPNGDVGNTTNLVSYTISTNSINLSQVQTQLQRKCFRYRIRTACSDWSDWCLIGAGFMTGDAQFIQYADCIPSNPCDNFINSINITDDVLSGTTLDYDTYVNITAVNTVQTNATSTYRASNSITLNVGFHAQDDSSFRAFIDDCIAPLNREFQYSNDSGNNISEENSSKRIQTITVYPNPTKSEITVSSKLPIINLKLTDQIGRTFIILPIDKIDNLKPNLSLNNLPIGVYFLKISLKNGETITKQVIKQ